MRVASMGCMAMGRLAACCRYVGFAFEICLELKMEAMGPIASGGSCRGNEGAAGLQEEVKMIGNRVEERRGDSNAGAEMVPLSSCHPTRPLPLQTPNTSSTSNHEMSLSCTRTATRQKNRDSHLKVFR
ncbi:hypothetical protein BKA64DRAFT_38758 [Cadophora sp. MPI-SDFR-AT-0126]|nr:hypothetical protein BKA64DRAFT_38758 [Leotiomycetes sp. MPI-SDFR-AT-0126]